MSEYNRYFYENLYRPPNESRLNKWFHSFSHRRLEKGLEHRNFSHVLEVGAGSGEHLEFVRHQFETYVCTDLVAPPEPKSHIEKVICKIADVSELPFKDGEFDRVLATCLLHHVRDSEAAMAELRRVTRVGGLISILLPCDPGLLYRAAWLLSSGRQLKKMGVTNPRTLHAKEHPNHFYGLHQILLDVFRNDEISTQWWPLFPGIWNANLFAVIQIVKGASPR